MKFKSRSVFWGLVLFVSLLSNPMLFAHDSDDDDEKKEDKWHWQKHWKGRQSPDLNFNVGLIHLSPLGDFYDRWNDGTGFLLGIEGIFYDWFTFGVKFSDVGLDPNPKSVAADLTDWDTTIYTWSMGPKLYFIPRDIYLTVDGGFSDLRRNIPNYAVLSATDQANLNDENTFSFFAGIGFEFWHFILLEAGYFHIFDEGGASMLHFILSF
jgi:hypothetical protein